jgi:lipoprotein-releasing system ATP-binding protein
MLNVAHLSKDYPTPRGALAVLSDVSFSLAPGDAAAIMGPSGSGKSSLLYVIGALEPPTSGTVSLEGQDPFQLPPAALAAFRNRSVGFVFQDHCLLPQCTVLENVLIPTLVAPAPARSVSEKCEHTPGRLAPPAKNGPNPQIVPRDARLLGARGAFFRRAPSGDGDATARARMLIEQVGLSARIDHRPGELSGGERQRVAIARALVREPRLLLCDEPTGNLDRASAGNVAALLMDLHRQQQTILIVVTHSAELAANFPVRFELIDRQLHRR